MKKNSIALLTFLIVIGTIMFLFIGKMDQLIKETIETEGTAALGSPVHVDTVVTNLKQGKITITGLTIANPNGYSTENAIEISSFSANVDYTNQVIQELVILQPTINAEQRGSKNNFKDLLDNMPVDEEETSLDDEFILTIKRLSLKNATINLITSDLVFGEKKTELGNRSFVMDDFILNNLSGTSSDISEDIAQRLTAHVSVQIARYIKKELTKMARDKLIDKAKEKFGEHLKGLFSNN